MVERHATMPHWAWAHWQKPYRQGQHPTAAPLTRQWNAAKHGRYPWGEDVHQDANPQPFHHL